MLLLFTFLDGYWCKGFEQPIGSCPRNSYNMGTQYDSVGYPEYGCCLDYEITDSMPSSGYGYWCEYFLATNEYFWDNPNYLLATAVSNFPEGDLTWYCVNYKKRLPPRTPIRTRTAIRTRTFLPTPQRTPKLTLISVVHKRKIIKPSTFILFLLLYNKR